MMAYLETILKLIERFVVAHELIAANSAKQTIVEVVGNVVRAEEKSSAVKDEPTTVKAKPEEDDLSDDEPEEKPKTRKPRATKPKAEPEPDLDKLREEIETMSKHVGAGPSDKADHEMDDLMDEYDVRSVKKLKDLQVQEFHKELKAIVAKYYDITED